jgi:hypothetical protein
LIPWIRIAWLTVIMRKIIPMHIKGEKSGSEPGTSKTECPILVQIKVMGDVDRRIQIKD